MGDSDRSTDGFDLEDLREEVARRKLLLGVAVLGGGSLLITQSDSTQKEDTDELAQAETQLVDVAERVNEADLANPREASFLHNEITQSVKPVTDTLDQHDSGGPKTEQRASALNAAIDYYNTLARTLNTGTTLQSQVAESELEVLRHKRSLGYEPVTAFDLGSFEESITRLSQSKKDPETVTSDGRKLVPDQSQVIDSLRVQRDVFDRHLTAQQTYLDTAMTIESGIRAHEQSQYDTARSKLRQARETLSSGIPQTELSYHLSNAGLSLEQYATLLDLRREGVSKLLSVCDESIPEKERRTVANTALNLFFEVRQTVTN
ncbi:hypothetical protein [Haloferax volcanii]|uniref:hypothetical protein n=1 Tax=Haloferax volcanii TaxID=2246 RepID=UPI003852D268